MTGLTDVTDADWRPRAAALADRLRATSKLTNPEWHRAVADTPRHLFVPVFHRPDRAGRWTEIRGDRPDQREEWLDAVYANTVLVTSLARTDHGPVVRSSSSQPGLMTHMLEILAIDDGHRVLEIGTGTGYNAALLSHRLGADNVYSIDIGADLVDTARPRLAGLGHHPTLAVGDGTAGMPDHAPFDRLVATCAVPAVPAAWLDQVRPGGILLTDLKLNLGAGSLVRLTRGGRPGLAVGRFDPVYATFMDLRHPGQPWLAPRLARDDTNVVERTTTIDPMTPWTDLVVWFIAAPALGPGISYGQTGPEAETDGPTGTWITALDGSWAEVSPRTVGHGHLVREGGPRRLWRHVEDAHTTWLANNRPGWERFGLTVDAGEHTLWLDTPDQQLGPPWTPS